MTFKVAATTLLARLGVLFVYPISNFDDPHYRHHHNRSLSGAVRRFVSNRIIALSKTPPIRQAFSAWSLGRQGTG